MEDKYLPIGTLVLLKNDFVMYMIIGYLNKNENGEIKEYVLVPFPYGLMADKMVSYFNHSDIERILFIGYKNEKYNEFNLILNSNN